MRALPAIAIAAALVLAGCGDRPGPEPTPTLTAEQLDQLNDAALLCIDGDPFACNRLRDMAAALDAQHEQIGATCGYILDEPLPRGEYCE